MNKKITKETKKEQEAKKAKEIRILLDKLVLLRRKYKISKSTDTKRELASVQECCIKELEYLVEARARRYKGFSNYDDLCQDGRLALYLALQSYEPDKGDFFWWANKYIKTKISREANRHSTIKIPLKHAKQIQPYKVSQLPVIVDNEPNTLDSLTQNESERIIRNAVKKLPKDQRRIIELHFEMKTSVNNTESSSIGKICETLNINRVSCLKLMNDAKQSLRQELESL